MAKGRGSLADQLADLNNVAPVDYDFEEEAHNFDAGRKAGMQSDESEGEEEAARSHALHNLVKVAPSEMRRRANFIEDADDETRRRYKGVKTTRDEMFADEGDASSISDSQEGTDGLVLEEESGSEDVDDEMASDEQDSEGVTELDDLSDDSASTSSAKMSVKVRPSKKTLRFVDEEQTKQNGAGKAVQSDAALLEELRHRAKAEAQRGRDTKRQMDAWGKLLGMRIRAQKPVRGVTRIPTDGIKDFLTSCSPEDRASYDEVLSTLDQLSSQLFLLQDRLLRSYASTSDDDTGGVQRSLHTIQGSLKNCARTQKRKLDDDEFDEHLDAALSLNERVHAPLWRSVLAKWTWRTSPNVNDDAANKRSTGKFDANGSGGLKAVNQSAQDQIERGMRGEAFERLRKRTRVWRGNENESRLATSASIGVPDTNSTSTAAVEDIDVFDDSDFYSALLRELIDSKADGVAHGSHEQVSSAWAQAANRAAKKHRDVDRKASKGRRLRYDVHEKVQNFMPPIPAETWSIEQIDRLIHQIRSGNAAPSTADDLSSDPVEVAETVELGGLRLFG